MGLHHEAGRIFHDVRAQLVGLGVELLEGREIAGFDRLFHLLANLRECVRVRFLLGLRDLSDHLLGFVKLALEVGYLLLNQRQDLVCPMHEGLGIRPSVGVALEFLLGPPSLRTGLSLVIARLGLLLHIVVRSILAGNFGPGIRKLRSHVYSLALFISPATARSRPHR